MPISFRACDVAGKHAEHAGAGQQDRYDTEPGEQEGDEAVAGERLVEQLRQRRHVVERKRRINCADRGTKVGDDRLGTLVDADDDILDVTRGTAMSTGTRSGAVVSSRPSGGCPRLLRPLGSQSRGTAARERANRVLAGPQRSREAGADQDTCCRGAASCASSRAPRSSEMPSA